MELLFYIAGMSFIIVTLIYDYFRTRSHFKEYKTQLKNYAIQIKSDKDAEQHLHEEVTQLKNKLQRNLEDPVTKLLGWHLFEDRINQSIKESARYQLTLGVLFVDIDGFKVINDALSYEVGDELLQEVAKRLLTCIRQVDSASRFTKDTFVILLTQLSKPETAVVIAQRILQTIAEPFFIQGNELFITVGIGIAIYPNDGETTAALLRSADHALHLAKEKGKQSYQFYQERIHAKSQRELALHTRLNNEAVFQDFVIYYQPIINVVNNAVICMEALLQWELAEFGLISSEELHTLAEKQRKQNAIVEWLLRTACKQFLEWKKQGFSPEMIGIPISIKQLENSHFIYRISQILQELQFNPEFLLLEIKESSSPLSFDVLEKAFNMLHYLKIKIAVENFGAGSLSLLYLKKINVNYLKLDRALIEDVTTDKQTVDLVKSIVYLANSMSVQIFVQGVSSREQLVLLKELGCTYMQGNFLSAPISEDEVIEKMVTTAHH